MSSDSEHSDFDDEGSKWDYFRKLKQLEHDQVDEHDVTLRKYIDETQSSMLSDEMNAMERAIKLESLRDQISDNIVEKIDDPKDRMLIGLLYNVCNDIDPTRMHFIKFCILLYEHGILNNLEFLMDNDSINSFKTDDIDGWSDVWSDEDEDNESNNDNDERKDDIEIDEHGDRQRMSFSSLVPHLNEIKTDSDSQIPMLPLTSANKSITMNELSSRYHREFKEIECIGFGAFGTVYKVKHHLDSSIYAIKKILYKHNGNNHEQIKRDIIREVSIMAQLNHDNIVRYYTSWIEPMITTNIDSNNESKYLSPNGSAPIKRNKELSMLLSSETKKSLIAPNDIYNYWSNKVHYSCLFVQTEYCGSYTLSNFINNMKRIPDRDDNMHLFAQILLGLAHCHSNKMIHRDLKPENIFLVNKQMQYTDNIMNAQQLTAKIGDFGLSRSLMNDYQVDSVRNGVIENDKLTANTGTETYAAPEQLAGSVYNVCADIYSLGIILFEMIQAPFVTMMERRIAISNFRKFHEIDDERIDSVKFGKEVEIMISMTQINPNLRPSAYDLILDEFIQIYWMKNVLNGAIPAINDDKMNPLKSLEYKCVCVECIRKDNNDESNNNDSPTFLISSPSTPPKTLSLDNNDNNTHRNVVKVMSPLSIRHHNSY